MLGAQATAASPPMTDYVRIVTLIALEEDETKATMKGVADAADVEDAEVGEVEEAAVVIGSIAVIPSKSRTCELQGCFC